MCTFCCPFDHHAIMITCSLMVFSLVYSLKASLHTDSWEVSSSTPAATVYIYMKVSSRVYVSTVLLLKPSFGFDSSFHSPLQHSTKLKLFSGRIIYGASSHLFCGSVSSFGLTHDLVVLLSKDTLSSCESTYLLWLQISFSSFLDGSDHLHCP